jgi:xanthine/uracil permease
MSNTPNIGSVITSGTIRKYVYGVYAVAALIVGGAAAYFLGIDVEIPQVVIGSQAVIAYLAIPVGALALANTSSANKPTD